MSDKNALKKELQNKFFELRKIIKPWDLIPDSPEDEFDYLNHKILGCLYKNAGTDKITRVLEKELVVTYGLDVNIDEAKKCLKK